MKRFISRYIKQIEWGLGAVAIVLPVTAWLAKTDLNDLSLYDIFPPLGLIAFGLMWTHFVMGALRRFSGLQARQRDTYMSVSMGLVLALIILHPGLLWIALYKDGYGLPPQSHVSAYSSELGFVALGTIGLLIFLAFELKRFYGQRKWWKIVDYMQLLGMGVIFIHALGIGDELAVDWFRLVWIFYGISFLVAVVYSQYIYKKLEIKNAKK